MQVNETQEKGTTYKTQQAGMWPACDVCCALPCSNLAVPCAVKRFSSSGLVCSKTRGTQHLRTPTKTATMWCTPAATTQSDSAQLNFTG